MKQQHWIESFEKLEALLRCSICHNTLKYPTLLTTCSHIFCESCIQQALENASYCPLCKTATTLQCLCAAQGLDIDHIVQLVSKIRQGEIFQSILNSTNDTGVDDMTVEQGGVNNSSSVLVGLNGNQKRLRTATDWKEATVDHTTTMKESKNCNYDNSNKQHSTITLLPTGLDAKQYMFLKRVVAKLGRAHFATSFDTKVTHLVTGHYHVDEKVKRTMKLCLGMVHNCRILSFEWIVRCHMANDWISTLGFEMKATWIKPGTVFSHEHFFLGEYKGQVPNQSELELLVTLGKGNIVTECLPCVEDIVQFVVSADTDELLLHRKYPNIAFSIIYPEQLLDRICLRS